MPQEHESLSSIGPPTWPADADERIELARKVTHGVRAKVIDAQEAKAKVMNAPAQTQPQGVQGAQTK